MKRCTTGLMLVVIIILLSPHNFSCKKIDLKREILITTRDASNITHESATLKGAIADPGEDNSFNEYGFVYSLTGTPMIGDEKVQAGSAWADGAFEEGVTGLLSNTPYYYRSYVIQSGGEPLYGNILSFKTIVNPDVTLPDVATLNVTDITPFSARIGGEVTDNGGADITRRGFCISTDPMPDIINDQFSDNGPGMGTFFHTFLSLTPETEYYVRAYAENQKGVAYGQQITFTTEEGGGPVSEWLHYDDGNNFDGIGLNDGGNFDVAIRFTPQQLAPYNGFQVTRIKFFPKVGLPVEYSVEIFEGAQPTLDDIMVDQFVEFPAIDDWNDVALFEPHTIDATKELWVGYYISGQEAGTFPAGIDEGPGDTGFGDMISVDNLESWITLADAGIDANWNIQVFVTNQAGEEIPISREAPEQSQRRENPEKASGFSSSKQSIQ